MVRRLVHSGRSGLSHSSPWYMSVLHLRSWRDRRWLTRQNVWGYHLKTHVQDTCCICHTSYQELKRSYPLTPNETPLSCYICYIELDLPGLHVHESSRESIVRTVRHRHEHRNNNRCSCSVFCSRYDSVAPAKLEAKGNIAFTDALSAAV